MTLTLAVGACGSGGSSSPAASEAAATAAPSAAPSADASAAPSAAALEPETKEFAVAFGGPGVSTVALLSAVRKLNEEGWNIATPELSAGELQLQGVASGQFQVSSGNGPNVLALAQQGLPVKAVMSRIKNEWTLYAKSAIESCEDLDGVKLAIHSEGSPATFMVRDYIAKECPGTEPQYIILPGSENRFAALLADEIDASPIELSDAIQLEAQGGDRFRRLASFAEELPNLTLTPTYANTEWAAQNPNTLTLLLAKVLEQHRAFNADPAYFKEEIIKTLEGVNEETIDATVDAYVDLEMYDPNGGLTPEQQQFSIDFVENAGGIEPGLTPEQAFDRTYLDRALEQLGS
jgi:ABC-type nitrate/sulfonate/bicarbonate transport system substrate-binding protein